MSCTLPLLSILLLSVLTRLQLFFQFLQFSYIPFPAAKLCEFVSRKCTNLGNGQLIFQAKPCSCPSGKQFTQAGAARMRRIRG